MNLENKRRAYFVLESITNDKGEFQVCIAVENVSGYYKTDWFWGNDFEVAEKIAKEKNEKLGITPSDEIEITLSTMRKGWRV